MELDEVRLPGLGLRHDFTLASGRRVGVVSLRHGERQLVVYDEYDSDAVQVSVDLEPEEASVLAELLGAPKVIERLHKLREQVEGLTTTGIPIGQDSPFAGRTLADTEMRTRTGASIVAVVHHDQVTPSPTPTFRFQEGDKVVVVGTPQGVRAAEKILNPDS